MHTDSETTDISLLGFMPYMTVVSLEMSDEPALLGFPSCVIDYINKVVAADYMGAVYMFIPPSIWIT